LNSGNTLGGTTWNTLQNSRQTEAAAACDDECFSELQHDKPTDDEQ
jgi:hypothetical protein